MKGCWLHRGGCDRLLIFCSGWGMDPEPFRSLDSGQMDVLMLYDYREMAGIGAYVAELGKYRENYLLGWSMGVWCGQRLFGGHAHLFTRKVAINGTLCPVDDTLGIPRQLFAGTMNRWSAESRLRFYRRMCPETEVLDTFLACQPTRELTGQQAELAQFLEIADCLPRHLSIYDTIYISDDDRIVPTAHQLRYWGEEGVRRIVGGHFPFYRWRSWSEMLGQDRAELS